MLTETDGPLSNEPERLEDYVRHCLDGPESRIDSRGLTRIAKQLDQSLARVVIREQQVEGRSIHVVDAVLDAREAECCQQDLERRPYKLGEYDFAGDDYPIFSSELTTPRCLTESMLCLRILTLMRRLHRDEVFRLQRAYVNLSRYGDMEYPHRDCGRTANDLTALYYGNAHWQPEFGGETLFFHADTGTALAVTPRPGRLVLFRGAILHLGSVPTRVCPSPRYSLALKFETRRALRRKPADGIDSDFQSA